jgi:hypothetical protein
MARRHVLSPLSPRRGSRRLRNMASIDTAPAGEPATIAGRIVRITVEPATSDTAARMIACVTDGTGEAALPFSREEAPRLATGLHVVADGLFADFDQPRTFDPILLAVVDDDHVARSVFPPSDHPR